MTSWYRLDMTSQTNIASPAGLTGLILEIPPDHIQVTVMPY